MLSAGASSVTGMSRRGQTIMVSVAGVLAVALYAAWAAVQLLIVTPLAAMPGWSLDEIRRELSAHGESLSELSTLIILGVGPLLALVVAAVAIRSNAHPAIPAMSFLSLLMLGSPGVFVASFGPGMALADTFMIGGGYQLPGVLPLYAVGAVSGIVLVAGIVIAGVRTRAATLGRARAAAPAATASAPGSVTD